MGMDVYGVKPSSETGKYFRNTIWSWAALWAYVCKVCPDLLTPRDMTRGEYNAGHKISAKKAGALGKRLLELVRKGKVQAYARAHGSRRRTRVPESGSAALLAASRVAKVLGGRPRKPRLSVRNVKDFASFCLASGGFEIC
jgi:hypothetical protein